MTRGARAGFDRLYRDFGGRVEFVSIYVREAHPGENYSHHSSAEQKLRYARDWARLDQVEWTVAVDALDGSVHRRYGGLPNSVYLIDSSGQVAFRALWAGQEGLIRKKLEQLLEAEQQGPRAVNLGEQENLVIPLLHGAIEFEHTLTRAGEKAKEDFRREMGNVVYGLQKLMSQVEPVVHSRSKDSGDSTSRAGLQKKAILLGVAAGVLGILAAACLRRKRRDREFETTGPD